MNSTNVNILIGISIIAVVFIIVFIGMLLFAYKDSLSERKSRFRDAQTLYPDTDLSTFTEPRISEPLPTPWPKDDPNSSNSGGVHIRFGNSAIVDAVDTPPDGGLKWGSPIDSELLSGTCPVCRLLLQDVPGIIRPLTKCSVCGTIYHHECWDVLSQHCSICHGRQT